LRLLGGSRNAEESGASPASPSSGHTSIAGALDSWVVVHRAVGSSRSRSCGPVGWAQPMTPWPLLTSPDQARRHHNAVRHGGSMTSRKLRIEIRSTSSRSVCKAASYHTASRAPRPASDGTANPLSARRSRMTRCGMSGCNPGSHRREKLGRRRVDDRGCEVPCNTEPRAVVTT
jgi:hypothetical protein